MLVVFGWLGGFIARLAGRLPRPRSPELALALRNIAAPDGLTRSVVLSLGTGLSLLVAVALANSSMVAELQDRLPEQAPDYFLLDISPKETSTALKSRVVAHIPGTAFVEAPMLRGRLVALKGTPVEDVKVAGRCAVGSEQRSRLELCRYRSGRLNRRRGDVVGEGLSRAPRSSLSRARLPRSSASELGDSVTVNVLGRNIEATIANLREVKWESLAINFVMVFSPNTLEAAPHNLLATVRLPPGTAPSVEADMVRELGRAYPSVSAIRVRDAIDRFAKLFAKVMVAVQVAGSVTLAAGALVLAGALATAQRRRILEAVILKTIGARRRQILKAHAYEYALLAAIAAFVAVALGSVVAWVAVTRLMEIDYVFSAEAVLRTLAVAAAMITVFGGIGTWAILRAPAVPYLRSE